MRKPRSVAERFTEKYMVDTAGCWLWRASMNNNGYGQIAIGTKDGGDRRRVLAHRLSYELARGPIPEGMSLDHLCRKPACVNPDHLEPVSHAENMRRSRGYRRKTECKSGHALTPDNLVPRAGKEGQFRCKACLDAARAESATKHRDAKVAKAALYRDANRERVREYAREYAKTRRAADPEAARLKLKAWRDANRDRYNEAAREYQRRRRKE
jgi:hypothetical protein